MAQFSGDDRPAHWALGPRRRVAALGAGLGLIGALTYVGLADPHRPGFVFPGCPFKALTGWNCPACGGLRMTHDLLHVDLAAAVVDNVFVLIGLPTFLVWLAVRWRKGKSVLPAAAIAAVVIAVLSWTVIRNLPGFPLVPTFQSG